MLRGVFESHGGSLHRSQFVTYGPLESGLYTSTRSSSASPTRRRLTISTGPISGAGAPPQRVRGSASPCAERRPGRYLTCSQQPLARRNSAISGAVTEQSPARQPTATAWHERLRHRRRTAAPTFTQFLAVGERPRPYVPVVVLGLQRGLRGRRQSSRQGNDRCHLSCASGPHEGSSRPLGGAPAVPVRSPTSPSQR